MTKVAIMQPTYLPWCGYFSMIDQVDKFIFLDSVQFAKRSWQQRNKIKSSNGVLTLTVPVCNKGLRNQLIKEAKIDTARKYIKDHIKSIEVSYKKAPYFNHYSPIIFDILSQNFERIADLNIALIKVISEMLGIKANFYASSEMDVAGSKASLLGDICRKTNASSYLSPVGSKEYLGEGEEVEIDIVYHQYSPVEYKQLYGEFVPYLSVIDLLFNMGDNSLEVIKNGRSF